MDCRLYAVVLAAALCPGAAVADAAAPPVTESHLSLLFRNYSESLQFDNGVHKQAWVQGMQANFTSAYTQGQYGAGVDASLFAALKLNGGRGAGNMVHMGTRGTEQNEDFWYYLGGYAVKVHGPRFQAKYGLQSIITPYLEPYDNRTLPPAFRGLSVVARPFDKLEINIGDFDGVSARGYSYVRPLTSAYGGTRFERLRHLGVDWGDAARARLSLYGAQAQDVWSQYYLSASRSASLSDGVTLTGRTDLYYTRDQGASRQGAIDNKTYSVSLAAQRHGSELLFGYQRVLSDQFFDFVNETTGTYVANSGGADYNAPHERSLMLRARLDPTFFGVPGLQASFWVVSGWGADARVEAMRHSEPGPLHGLYWKAGMPAHGRHHEFGMKPSYTVQSGAMRNTRFTFVFIAHSISEYYPSRSGYRDYKLRIDVPVKVF
jgi:hypothetical protein